MKKRILSFLLATMMLVGTVLATGTSAEEAFYPDAADHWAREHIEYVSDKGMMNGIGDGLFGPDDAVSRAMVVTVLHRLAGSPEPARESKFPDLKEDWYKDAVAWGAAKGIVKGYEDGTFGPDNDVSRQELVTFIGRYAELNYIAINGAVIDGFVDAGKVESWALDYFKWAFKTGLVNGVEEDVLGPLEGATRAQFATIMHRYDTTIEGFEYELVYNEPLTGSYEIEVEYSLRDDADFFVSTTGDDANDGKTKDTAFKTFERARDAVREFKKTATDEIVVAFMAGDYGYLDNITFTAEDAGTEEVPITYCKYGDGDVIFSNGVNVYNEEFKPIDESDHYLFKEKNFDKISKVYIGDRLDKIGQFTVLFDGSQICWEARYPNKSGNTDVYMDDCTTRVDQFKSVRVDDKSRAYRIAEQFNSYEGMKVTGHFRTGWLIDTFLVESYDPVTGLMEFDFDNPDFYPWGSYPMVKWSEEEMANGTAFEFTQERYDHGNRGAYVLMYEERYNDSLFFHNIPDQLDDEGEYWVDTKTMTLYVYGVDGDYTFSNGGTFMTVQTGADHLSFVGLEFNGSSETAVYSHADHITFDLCEFRNISGPEVINAMQVHNFTVSNCEFHKFGCQGINFRSDANFTLLETSNNKLYNNYFHDFGYIDYWKNAVNFSDVKAVISHNVFENGAHGGVVFGGPLNIIEYNVFDRMMVSTEDFGAVYTWNESRNRGNEIRYNLFKNIENGSKYSIYLDEMTHGQIVHGNIFYKASQAVVQNGGRDNEIYDNILIDTPAFTSSAKLYDYYELGTTADFKPGDGQYNLTMTGFPQEGHPMYETWKSLWPIMYEYHTDITKIGEPECVFSNTNYYRNNSLIGYHNDLGDDSDSIFAKTGVFEGNKEYTHEENPLFVNPTIGDYRIRDGVGYEDIDFEKIGRE